MDRQLLFCKHEPEAYATAVAGLVRQGVRRILVAPWSDDATRIIDLVRPTNPDLVYLQPVQAADDNRFDALLIPTAKEEAVAAELLKMLDARVPIIAPITDWYYANRPLFLISQPKAGTHLLMRLVEAFGYTAGVGLTEPTIPGAWYCVEFTNTHTRARDFFFDSVRHAAFGNRNHPFMRCPAIMIYRNPMDILVSEAGYYHVDGKTAFSGYLSNLSLTERLSRLIDDPWLLGSIRDRVGDFLPWMDFPNVIPISFEELVGPEGGSDAELQEDLIWSLQLKLNIPGSPGDYTTRLYDPNSPTYNVGRIGRYRELFTPDLFHRFESLNQDFMEALGYAGSNLQTFISPPRRHEEFLARSLLVSDADFTEVPYSVEFDFLGTDIVRFRNLYYAVPRGIPELNLQTLSENQLGLLSQARRIDELKQLIVAGNARLALARRWQLEGIGSVLSGASPPRLFGKLLAYTVNIRSFAINAAKRLRALLR